ncbi:MAG: hypothetical protein ACOC56_05220 [Atribacterota bacterium]
MLISESNDVCFFTTCNEKYLSYASIAIKSFQRFFPKSKGYIFTSEKNILRKKDNIEIITPNFACYFVPSSSKWPKECFWWYMIPEILAKQHIKFSCYIDPDVYCFKKHNVKINDDIDIALFRSKKNRNHTGYIWFNNENLSKKAFYQKMISYSDTKYHIGDQELFNKYIKNINKTFNILYFSPQYIYFTHRRNMIKLNKKRQNFDFNIQNLYIVHYVSKYKPWNTNIRKIKSPIRKKLIEKYYIDKKSL